MQGCVEMAEATIKKSSRLKGVVKFFKDTRQELKKVIWPNRKQLTNNTITVFMFCFIFGGIIWIFDAAINGGIVQNFFR
jgi:preprotein translocase subunit SecE